MNTMQAPPLGQKKQKRIGLMKARIGSRHVIKGPDGEQRSFTVREKMRHSKVKMVCVCLTCKKTWDSEDALVENHPETAVMRKQQEHHVYAWWSEDSLDKTPVVVDAKDAKDKTAKPIDWSRVVGLLSDEE